MQFVKLFLLLAIIVVILPACNDSAKQAKKEDMQTTEAPAVQEKQEKEKPGDISLPSSTDDIKKLIGYQKGEFKYSVEDFFRNPEKSAYRLSPDGTHFSYMGPYERRRNIFIQKIGSDKAVRITSETDRDISGYFWANDNRLVFIKDAGGDENFKLYAVDKDGSDAKDLTPFDGVRIQIIDDLEDNEDEMIIGMNKNNPQLFEPYRLNINTGDLKQLAKNENPAEPISSWMTDHDGKLRIAGKVKDGTNTVLMYRDNEDEDFREVLTTDFRESVDPLFFDFDNSSTVYASSNLNRDKSVITKFDMNTGKEVGKIIFEHPNVDVSGLSYSRKRKVPTSISYNFDKRHRHFLDKESERIYKRLEKDLGDYEIFITSTNKAEDKFMVRTYSDRSLGTYYFYDLKTDKLEKIADVSPWLNEDHMAPMKPIKYTSRDGLTIRGYLTLPQGKEAKNLPVIINPHGGPWARDSWGFNPEVQLFASRGYAVLQMNFRGSTGFWSRFLGKELQTMGQNHARRYYRWCTMADKRRYCRS